MIMKEQLISFDTAKLAKEKGFNIECEDFYTNPRSKMVGIDEHGYPYSIKNIPKKLYTVGFEASVNGKNVIFAPTQSLLQKWLREEHEINLWIKPLESRFRPEIEGYNYFIHNTEIKGFKHTYEEALEKGLQEALKLL